MPAASRRSSPGGRVLHRGLADELRPAGAVRLIEAGDAAGQRPIAELGLAGPLEGVAHLDRRLGLLALLREDAPVGHQPAHHVGPLVLAPAAGSNSATDVVRPGQQRALAGERVEMELADPLLARGLRRPSPSAASSAALHRHGGGARRLVGPPDRRRPGAGRRRSRRGASATPAPRMPGHRAPSGRRASPDSWPARSRRR